MITPKKKRLNKEANLVRRAMSVNGRVQAGSDVHEAVKLAVREERAAVIAMLRDHAALARRQDAAGPFAVPLDQAVEDIEAGKHIK